MFIAVGLLMIARHARRAGCAALPPASLAKAAPAWVLATASAGAVLPQGRAFIFGSGLAIVPFLCQGVTAQQEWLASRKFIDAVAMGLITPAGRHHRNLHRLALSRPSRRAHRHPAHLHPPIYLGSSLSARWFVPLSRQPADQHVRQGRRPPQRPGAIAGAVIAFTRQTVTDIPTAAIAGCLPALQLWRKFREPVLADLSAIAGNPAPWAHRWGSGQPAAEVGHTALRGRHPP